LTENSAAADRQKSGNPWAAEWKVVRPRKEAIGAQRPNLAASLPPGTEPRERGLVELQSLRLEELDRITS
jgi:hypothetical protein